MKLVKILARELEAWPCDGPATQDPDKEVRFLKQRHDFFAKELAEDAGDDYGLGEEVTREMWETERAKLKATKANGDGWVRHRGGKRPVDADQPVSVRHRDGQVYDFYRAANVIWRHSGSVNDVMAWKVFTPAEQPDEHDLTSLAEKAGIKRMAAVASEVIITSGPIKWRDRIRELDTQRAEVESTYQRQISEITQERESLAQKLAGEGLALVEVVVQPVEGMSDWAKWREGDVIEFIKTYGDTPSFTLGKHYVVADVNMRSYNPVSVKEDDDGDYNVCKGEYFKFVSRPAT